MSHSSDPHPLRFEQSIRLTRRNILPMSRQTAIILRDASASMRGDKAQAAESACSMLVAQLAATENNGSFFLGVIDFSDQAVLKSPVVPAEQLRVPALELGSTTNVTAALELAESLLRGISQDELRPVVVLLSDGCHNGLAPPYAVAERIKLIADIVTVAFGADADDATLQAISSSAQHAYKCNDGGALRGFFSEVGTTLSSSLRMGMNSTRMLGQLNGTRQSLRKLQ